MSLNDTAKILYGSPLAKPKTAKFAIAVLLVLILIASWRDELLRLRGSIEPNGVLDGAS